MRRYLLILLVPITILLGCDRLSEYTKFYLNYDESIVIPASTAIDLPLNLVTPKIESNSETEFAANNTRKDLIEEVKLTTLNLTITEPSDSDFSFLESVAIYLNADSLSEIKIAGKDDIPNDIGNILELETFDTDMKEYITKDKFNLRVHTITKKMIGSDHHVDINAVFFVDAKILGQ